MVIIDFDMLITYGQVVLFKDYPPVRGLLWTDDHVAQGFAWSPRTVGFGIPDHDGLCRIEVRKENHFVPDPNCLWALFVPLEVERHKLRVGAVDDDRPFSMAPGMYRLSFEAFPGTADHAFYFRITFSDCEEFEFSIIKVGGEIKSKDVLLKNAEYA